MHSERTSGKPQLSVDLSHNVKKSSGDFFSNIYKELKRVAYSKIHKEAGNSTITATGLVHEVYLKMIDQTVIKAEDKSHFMAIAARCMRQILVDHARKKKAEKRGGNKKNLTYIDELLKAYKQSEEVVDLDDKLNELARFDERLADVVTLRFFGQMTVHSTAEALGVSERTVKRDWAKARGWLYKELKHKFY